MSSAGRIIGYSCRCGCGQRVKAIGQLAPRHPAQPRIPHGYTSRAGMPRPVTCERCPLALGHRCKCVRSRWVIRYRHVRPWLRRAYPMRLHALRPAGAESAGIVKAMVLQLLRLRRRVEREHGSAHALRVWEHAKSTAPAGNDRFGWIADACAAELPEAA